METNDVSVLISKFNEGKATPSEIVFLEKLIEAGKIDLTDFPSLSLLEDQVIELKDPSPSANLDQNFAEMLLAEKRKAKKSAFSFQVPSLSFFLPRFTLAATLLICGFIGGYFLNKPAPVGDDVKALSKQVDNLQEMVMLSLLEKESASERLRAVSLTSEMDQASKKVTTALLETLNNDNNVNVRLAALDALRPYVRDNVVRTELVKSISKQDSPMVQVALAELMRDIQEKKSVTEFNKILKGDKTPEEVKKSIREKIQVLI